jgi:hypothetical protein
LQRTSFLGDHGKTKKKWCLFNTGYASRKNIELNEIN